MKNKGFVMAEALIVSAVVLTTLVLIYSQFAKINKSYGENYYYDNINDIYALNSIANFISESNSSSLINNLSSYLDLTDCSLFTESSYCSLLFSKSNIKNIIFTYSDTNYILESLSSTNPYNLKFTNYIKSIGSDSDYEYILLAEFNDDTYAYIPYSTTLNPHYFSFADGTPIYFNVTTGNICTKVEAIANKNSTTNQYTGVKTGCMKFYSFLDNKYNKTIKLILDHNIISNINWAATADATYGPVALLPTLKSNTDNWLGTLELSNYSYSNANINYSISYRTDSYKARLITANEVKEIVANNSWDSKTSLEDSWFYLDSKNKVDHADSTNKSNYAFLFDNLYQSVTYGANVSDDTLYDGNHVEGYWTSDAIYSSSNNKAWTIYGVGSLNNEVTNSLVNGIRPVIEISKSKLVNYRVESDS